MKEGYVLFYIYFAEEEWHEIIVPEFILHLLRGCLTYLFVAWNIMPCDANPPNRKGKQFLQLPSLLVSIPWSVTIQISSKIKRFLISYCKRSGSSEDWMKGFFQIQNSTIVKNGQLWSNNQKVDYRKQLLWFKIYDFFYLKRIWFASPGMINLAK
jgi:hypothetical protein